MLIIIQSYYCNVKLLPQKDQWIIHFRYSAAWSKHLLILGTWGFSDFGWLNLGWTQHCLGVSSQLLCLPWVFIIVRHTATWQWGRIQGPVPFINYIRTGILPLASWPRVIAQLVMWSSQTLWVSNWRKYCLLLW